MGLFNFFSKKPAPERITTDAGFWNWFQQNAAAYHAAIINRQDFNETVIPAIVSKLHELDEGFFMLAGILGDDTAEMVLTAEGNVAKIARIEQLAAAAPAMPGWKITALKPSLEGSDFTISMNGFEFSAGNISFFANTSQQYPDDIDLTFVYANYDEHNEKTIRTGVFIFIDNYLGELAFATTIDNVSITGPAAGQPELVPISKLKDNLQWRQKEFVEKYEGIRHDTENDNYAAIEGRSPAGQPLIAVVNHDLLHWNAKASHPWFTIVRIPYKAGANGMPDEKTFHALDSVEEEILRWLKDAEGCLNLGRETADGLREMYFACKDFRKPSLVLADATTRFADIFKIEYTIFPDKYWRIMDRFITH
jgi:hypothetical protein